MQKTYIWECSGWPYLTWDNKELSLLLGEVRNKQGQLIGKISILGDDLKKNTLQNMAISDIMASAQIEGVTLDKEQVTSAIEQYLSKKRFNMSEANDISVGASQVFTDTLYNYKDAITEEKLLTWKCALEGNTTYDRLNVGWHKTDSILDTSYTKPVERKMEHLTTPIPANTNEEMKKFLIWINTVHPTDPVIKAGVAYLRFILIRPFESNNGYIARSIANVFLSRSDNAPERIYGISAQIEKDIKQYDEILTHIQTGSTDITEWLRWFLYCMENALNSAEASLMRVMNKSKFFDKFRLVSLNDRQLKMINLLLDGVDYKLSSSTWASINNCSPDTALRDIQHLISKKILCKENAGGRSTSYRLNSDSVADNPK